MARVTMLACVLYFLAVLLLLLVSLSVPIIKSIYLFRLSAYDTSILSSSASATATFGVWGYCISSIQVSVAGIQRSAPGDCTKPRLGFRFDSYLANALHVSGSENLINRSLTAVLVLHPIACIFTFAVLVTSLLQLRRRQPDGSARAPSALLLGLGIFTALLTTLVFLLDVVLVAVVRQKLNNVTGGHLTLGWGNAVWMSLGAAIALWAANAIALFNVFALRKKSRHAHTY